MLIIGCTSSHIVSYGAGNIVYAFYFPETPFKSIFFALFYTKILLPTASQIHLHVSQLEPGIQDDEHSWVFSKHKPALMFGTT
jgi:hypothetical protein